VWAYAPDLAIGAAITDAIETEVEETTKLMTISDTDKSVTATSIIGINHETTEVTFVCGSGTEVCKNGGPIDISNGDMLEGKTKEPVDFKAIVKCIQQDSNNFNCIVTIKDA